VGQQRHGHDHGPDPWEITAEEFRRVTEVTYLGAVNATLAALRRMRPRDRGTIIQVGSALAYRGIPLQGPYCAAKHAIQGFTESLTVELMEERSGLHLGEVHLPALNTPQFIWGRNKMPKAPQPVPPIYQPEVAARGIVWAADAGRRETWIAGSTAATIWGNRLARPFIARYLARTGFDGQQTDLPADAYPDDNLFSPADAETDHGTHGPFDDRARDASPLQVVSRHRGTIAAAGAGALALVVGSMARDRR
jgi:short-subunit dehydrogenase